VNLPCLILGLWCSQGTITGHATVQDGDTIYVNREPMRLAGIDAEELDEPHGPAAKQHLQRLIGSQTVTCEWEGWSYKRRVGVCHVLRDDYVNGWTTWHNLNKQMVADGFALDCARYSNGLYRSLEPAGARSRLIQKPYC
jgi:micrococcal nuclease